MIKLVLSDVDGTLIPLGSGVASANTMRAIQQTLDAGIRFGLATGRDIVELRQLFEGSDIAFRTGILSNGKKVMIDGEIARLTLIDNDSLSRLAAEISQYPGTMVTAYPYKTDASNPIYCMGVSEEELAAWAKTYAFAGTIVSEFPQEKIIGATIACTAGEDVLQKIERFVAEEFPEFDLGKPAARWWDILPKGVNKGTALDYLLHELDVARDEVVMFGDADNDLAILRAVENSVVVSGATAAAKAASRWQIGACEDEAVADALADIARVAGTDELPAFMQS